MPTASYEDASSELPRASKELLDRVRKKGRQVVFATAGSEELAYLEAVGAHGNVGGPFNSHILLRENPSKVALLEEFLHGTQSKLGFFDTRRIPHIVAEVMVKDFMLRHRKLLSLTDREILFLRLLRQAELLKASELGYNSK